MAHRMSDLVIRKEVNRRSFTVGRVRSFSSGEAKWKPNKVSGFKRDKADRIKRLCIYYMCIDDRLL